MVRVLVQWGGDTLGTSFLAKKTCNFTVPLKFVQIVIIITFSSTRFSENEMVRAGAVGRRPVSRWMLFSNLPSSPTLKTGKTKI